MNPERSARWSGSEGDVRAFIAGVARCIATVNTRAAAIGLHEARLLWRDKRRVEELRALRAFEQRFERTSSRALRTSDRTTLVRALGRDFATIVRRRRAELECERRLNVCAERAVTLSAMEEEWAHVREACEAFLLRTPLPISRQSCRLVWRGDGYRVASACSLPNDVTAVFCLDAASFAPLGKAARVADFVPDLRLPIVTRLGRAWMERGPERVSRALARHYVTELALGARRAQFVLRPRPTSTDGVRVVADIRHGCGETYVEPSLHDDARVRLSPKEQLQVLQFLAEVTPRCTPILGRRERLAALRLGDVDVFRAHLERHVMELLATAGDELLVQARAGRRSRRAESTTLVWSRSSGARALAVEEVPTDPMMLPRWAAGEAF